MHPETHQEREGPTSRQGHLQVRRAVRLSIRTLMGGEPLAVMAFLDETVARLKRRIAREVALFPSEMKLLLSERTLRDDEVLEDAGVSAASVLVLVLCPVASLRS